MISKRSPHLPPTATAKLAGATVALAVWSGAACAVSQDLWARCEYSPQSISACTQILGSEASGKDRAKAYWWRGLHYSDIKAYDRAIADFTASIELSPGDASAFNQRGFAHFYSNQYRQAISDFTRSLELDPNFQPENTMHFRGRAYSLVGDHSRAITDLTRVIESSPDENSYFYRGQSYFKLGDLRRARHDFLKALEISPRHETARSFLALVDAAEQIQEGDEKEQTPAVLPDATTSQNPPASTTAGPSQQEGLGTLE